MTDVKPFMSDVRKIDNLCFDYDRTVEIFMALGEPAKASDLEARLAEHGFGRGVDGVIRYPDPDKGYFRLVRPNDEPLPRGDEPVSELRFDAAIALMPLEGMEFEEFIYFVQNLCNAVGMGMYDVHGRQFKEEKLRKIGKDIDKIRYSMASRNLPPGGELAHRLFR